MLFVEIIPERFVYENKYIYTIAILSINFMIGYAKFLNKD